MSRVNPPSEHIAPLPRGAFHYTAFTVMWTATLVSNIGAWMYNAASGWLMVSLDAHPLVVSLVQVANTLPIFLFALPAGALADIGDKRRFLIAMEGATTLVSAIFAALVGLGHVTPTVLLLFMFLFFLLLLLLFALGFAFTGRMLFDPRRTHAANGLLFTLPVPAVAVIAGLCPRCFQDKTDNIIDLDARVEHRCSDADLRSMDRCFVAAHVHQPPTAGGIKVALGVGCQGPEIRGRRIEDFGELGVDQRARTLPATG